jgi:uncharacterized protein involved in exopolysaccharide biosynthesis
MDQWLSDYLKTGKPENLEEMSVEGLRAKTLEVISAIAEVERELAIIAFQLQIIQTGIAMLSQAPSRYTARMRIMVKRLEASAFSTTLSAVTFHFTCQT